MDREALVYVDLDGRPHLVARLWARTHKEMESATFEYDKAWLKHKERFGAKDNETRSYLEIVDALRQYGSQPSRIDFEHLIWTGDDSKGRHVQEKAVFDNADCGVEPGGQL